MKYIIPLLAATAYRAAGANITNGTQQDPTLQLSADPAFNFELLDALSHAVSGGADVTPVLGVAQTIEAGNMTSFSEAFYELALKTKEAAQDPDIAYDAINVRDTWFSASEYFRQADFYLHNNWSNPLIDSLWDEQTAAFNNALAALPVPGQRIQIPSPQGNFTVEAIWYPASTDSKKRPTLIIGNGYDAAQEDSYHVFVAPALARGYNCITYEGPGQPTVRRNQNKGFIYDWEKVMTPVVDWLLTERADDVDKNRLILIGNSFGGYLAARAAAFEPRISAAILIDGVWDAYAAFSSQLPDELIAPYLAGNYTSFDESILSLRASGAFPTSAAWGIDQGLWSFMEISPSAFFNRTKEFELASIVDKIEIPVFVGDAEYETFFVGQPDLVASALGDRATLHRFTGTVGYHCQLGAYQELIRTMFGWINKTLG